MFRFSIVAIILIFSQLKISHVIAQDRKAKNFLENFDPSSINLEDYEGQYRFAMEIELLERPLANLTRFFDFSKVDLNKLPKNTFNDYLLLNPDAYTNLPQALIEDLTTGLELKDVYLDTSKLRRNESNMMRPQIYTGKEDLSSQKLILTTTGSNQEVYLGEETLEKKIILDSYISSRDPLTSKAEFMGFDSKDGKINIRAQTGWKEVNERWNALPYQEKIKYITWEKVSPLTKAKIFLEQDWNIKVNTELENIPGLKDAKKIKALFSRLDFNRDGDAIEFRYKESVKMLSPKNYLEDLNLIGKISGIEYQLQSPLKALKNSSYHLNISKSADKINYDRLASSFEDLMLLNLIEQNEIGKAFTSSGQVMYTHYHKGFVSSRDNERFEFRIHTDAPDVELKKQMALLEMSEKEFRILVQYSRKKILNFILSNHMRLPKNAIRIAYDIIPNLELTKDNIHENYYKKLFSIIESQDEIKRLHHMIDMTVNSNTNIDRLNLYLIKEYGISMDQFYDYAKLVHNTERLDEKRLLQEINQYHKKMNLPLSNDLKRVTSTSGYLKTKGILHQEKIQTTIEIIVQNLKNGDLNFDMSLLDRDEVLYSTQVKDFFVNLDYQKLSSFELISDHLPNHIQIKIRPFIRQKIISDLLQISPATIRRLELLQLIQLNVIFHHLNNSLPKELTPHLSALVDRVFELTHVDLNGLHKNVIEQLTINIVKINGPFSRKLQKNWNKILNLIKKNDLPSSMTKDIISFLTHNNGQWSEELIIIWKKFLDAPQVEPSALVYNFLNIESPISDSQVKAFHQLLNHKKFFTDVAIERLHYVELMKKTMFNIEQEQMIIDLLTKIILEHKGSNKVMAFLKSDKIPYSKITEWDKLFNLYLEKTKENNSKNLSSVIELIQNIKKEKKICTKINILKDLILR